MQVMEIKKLQMSDLIKTKFDGKHCIGFEYVLKDDSQEYTFRFEKHIGDYPNANAWKMYAIVPDVYSENDKKLVQFVYGIPKEDMTLVKVAAIGLQLVRGLMQREITLCTTIDFLISEAVDGV